MSDEKILTARWEVKTWRYSVPNASFEGWAILFLDEAGCFAALSDYGDYSYRWPASGFYQKHGIREFLLCCDTSYLCGKIAPQQVIDEEGTKAALREHVTSLPWIAKKARDEMERIEAADLDSDVGWYQYAQDSEIEDVWELIRLQPHRQATAFLERAWPRLRDLIREEIDRERGFNNEGDRIGGDDNIVSTNEGADST